MRHTKPAPPSLSEVELGSESAISTNSLGEISAEIEPEVDEELVITRRTMTTRVTNANGRIIAPHAAEGRTAPPHAAGGDGEELTLQCKRHVMNTTEFDAGRAAPVPGAPPRAPGLSPIDEGPRMSAIERVEVEMRV